MNLVLTQEGSEYVWSVLVLGAAVKELEVRLFGESHTPLHTDTWTTLHAAELTVPGYSPIPMPAGSAGWSFADLPQGGDVLNQVPVWNFSAPCSVYGGFVALAGIPTSLFAWLFDTPYVFPVPATFYLNVNPSLISVP